MSKRYERTILSFQKKMKNNQKRTGEGGLFESTFGTVHDPRRTNKGNIMYPLSEVMFLVISATICGAEEWTTIEVFGKSQIKWLRKFFPYKNGVPSHDTLGDIFSVLDTGHFSECFIEWVSEISQSLGEDVVAIDGKRLRGSYDKLSGKSAIHVVSAFAADNNICLGQQITNEKSNEITAIPKLLDLIAIEGCIVTIDAMGCQKKIIEKILEKKADFIIAVKENQEELLSQVVKAFNVTIPADVDTQLDAGHGRVENRKCSVIDDLRFFDLKEEWTTIKTLIKIESERFTKISNKMENETRFYVSSLKADAKKINHSVRKHWSVENKLHWVLDVEFKEDYSRKRIGYSAANANIISKVAITLLDSEKNHKVSKKSKRMRAALDFRYREILLRL